MIKHIVFYKLKDRSEQEKRRIRDLFMSMQGKVEQLRSLEVGLDALDSERSYDVALICTFDSMEDMRAYRKHPEHMKIAAQIHAARQDSVSVDFECEA
nr:Dabb family protein [Maliibacterium massiliense]